MLIRSVSVPKNPIALDDSAESKSTPKPNRLTLTCVPKRLPDDWHETVDLTLLIEIVLFPESSNDDVSLTNSNLKERLSYKFTLLYVVE